MQITATSAVQAVQPAGRAAEDAPATGSGAAPAAGNGAAPAATGAPVRLLNPQPVIDPALGIVVTEYFNRAGDLTSQYPTEKALDNYRIHGLDGGTASASSGTKDGRSDEAPSVHPA